ncbi:hypothetical protein OP10G_3868 [Fimbriimonas ginsengisoli Gsoil 348]|uniref:Uncharacterized protein n=1 Tax=Fimbriimonas ginsengisoli Gsoil 348 TaxID=661478 RepID=A0A068NUW1_FIMGI|nr:hypothetical protein OP10G_3868 [Fimbriimonas ginsengisoli Gsoil 348]
MQSRPGDIRKEGPWLDLPMAVAICRMDGNLKPMYGLSGLTRACDSLTQSVVAAGWLVPAREPIVVR